MLLNRSLGALSSSALVILGILALTPGTWAQSNFKTLHKFTGSKDGGNPLAGLIFDQAGNLYGTALRGGVYGAGAVFELTRNSDATWTESVLYSFTGGNDGEDPWASLVFDADGNLYGTTSNGGNSNEGVVYKLTPSRGGWTESVLHNFNQDDGDGSYPTCALIFDSSGNLYGTTTSGGTHGAGTVFELTPNSGGSLTENILFDFTGGASGGAPYAGVIFDANGNLYGTTMGRFAAPGNSGIVFKLKPSKGLWTISVLHRFTGGNDGGFPGFGRLVMDMAENLYGTTSDGGLYGYGTVFELISSRGGWRETVVHNFANRRDGAFPNGGLILDSAGNIYGTTVLGGDFRRCTFSGCGVAFELAPKSNGGWKETELHDFHDHPGDAPWAGLTLDAAGNLYGTTNGDDTNTFGSVFEITR